jgi:thiamine biosynthesis protein ThiS
MTTVPSGNDPTPDAERPGTILVTVNGSPSTYEAGASVADVGSDHDIVSTTRGVAVARNGLVVPRPNWSREILVDGDRIEIVRAAAGG